MYCQSYLQHAQSNNKEPCALCLKAKLDTMHDILIKLQKQINNLEEFIVPKLQDEIPDTKIVIFKDGLLQELK